MTIERFYTIAETETEFWDSEALADMNARAAFGLYLIREGEATHLCSLTASSYRAPLGIRFIVADNAADTESLADRRFDAESEGMEEHSYGAYIDPAKVDPRFIAGPLEIDSEDVTVCEEYGETYKSALWEMARETWQQSPDEPGILLDSVFEQWAAEEIAKRRAENRPPLARDPLPLFQAAAAPIFAAIVSRFGLDPENLAGAEFEKLREADSAIKAEWRRLAWA